MTAQSTNEVNIYLTTGAPTSVTMTAAPSKTAPSSISAGLSGGANGDVVVIKDTNWSSLDTVWVASDVGGSDFDALGSDPTGESSASVAGKVDHYTDVDLTKLCLASLTINTSDPSTVSVATFCDPTASLPSQIQEAGTISFTGYTDVNSADYVALYAASKSQDQRYIRINLGEDQGYLVAPVTITSFTWDLPLDGAVGYSGTMVLGSKVKHCF